MRFATMLVVILSATGAGAPPPRVPVLVELFTSEGCSSCPSADALLETLLRDQPVDGVEVIPIGLHVDYFNYLGWKDTFSAAAFTERQQDYSRIFGPDSVYTPQMVVDGKDGIVGNDRPLAAKTIAAAARRPHLALHATAHATADSATITIDLPAAPAGGEKIQVVTAVTEDDLTTASPCGRRPQDSNARHPRCLGRPHRDANPPGARLGSKPSERRGLAAGRQEPPGLWRRVRADSALNALALAQLVQRPFELFELLPGFPELALGGQPLVVGKTLRRARDQGLDVRAAPSRP
jgi:hypothetical protein